MLFSYSDAAALISGLLVGFVLGLIGGGGSILAAPLLVYFVGIRDPHVAIGTGATAVAANALFNLFGHARAGHVHWPHAIAFTSFGFLGAMLGSTAGKVFDGQKLLFLFGLMMLAIAALMAFKHTTPAAHESGEVAPGAAGLAPAVALYGLGAGALAGFFGIGGGFLVVPALIAATKMPIILAIGSSLLSVTVFATTTAVNYAFSGLVDWRTAAFLLAGGAFGGVAGGLLASHMAMRKQALNRIFASVIASAGFYVVYRGALVLLKT